MQPRTRYAKSGDASIAYQVVGDGPFDVLFTPGFVSHLDLQWTDPAYLRFLTRLSSVCRLILFDKRGTGLSDPCLGVPSLQQRVDDMLAVLDAAGSQRAALLGFSDGGPATALFAATHPGRTTRLVMYGTFAKGLDPDHPGALPEANIARIREALENWGEGDMIALSSASARPTALQRRLWGIFERAAASPATARALLDAATRVDVTAALPAIRAPTLVLHRTDDPNIPPSAARFVAEAIPDARYREVEGADHVPFMGNPGRLLDEIVPFLQAEAPVADPQPVLATILFTDIVGSTERASAMGDRAWLELLEEHDRLVREELRRFQGREIKTTGDGFVAVFDGAERGVRCAAAIVDGVRTLGLEVRAGLHAGEFALTLGEVGGLAVHVGARVGALAGPGEVLVTSAVRDLAESGGLEFAERGTRELKGVPGRWRLAALRGGEDAAPARPVADHWLGAGERLQVRLARLFPPVPRTVGRIAQLMPQR